MRPKDASIKQPAKELKELGAWQQKLIHRHPEPVWVAPPSTAANTAPCMVRPYRLAAVEGGATIVIDGTLSCYPLP